MRARKVLLASLSFASLLTLPGLVQAKAVLRVPSSVSVTAASQPGGNGTVEPGEGKEGGPSTPTDPHATGEALSNTCWEPVVFPPTKIGQQSEVDFSVTSDGTGPLTVSNFRFDGMNPQDFRIAPNCPTVLQPGQSCTVKVTFEPTASKTRMGSLLYDTNEDGGSTCLSMFVAQAIGYDGAKGYVERIYMTGSNVADGATLVQLTAEVFDGEFKPLPIDETVFWTANGAVVYQHAVSVNEQGIATVQMLAPPIPGPVTVNARLRNNKMFSTVIEFVPRP